MMNPLFFLLILFSIIISGPKKKISSDLLVTQLKCNNLVNPLGTDNKPFFSWIVESKKKNQRQTAYRIIISSDLKKINSGEGDILDSGKTISDQSLWIRYNGKELTPGEKYFWRVQIWDDNNSPSAWSEPAFFVTGLFNEKDWNGAKWIGFESIPDSLKLIPGVHGNGDNLGKIAKKRCVIPYFRKEFSIDKNVKRTLVFVSGLGQYEFYFNGETVGDHFLSPGWTQYNKSYLYDIFDITDKIKNGTNALGAIVGNGFFNINRERYRKLVIAYGAPEMILKLEIEYNEFGPDNICRFHA